jgi:COMPASS component SWD3
VYSNNFLVLIGYRNGSIKVYNQSFAFLNSFQAHTGFINRIKQYPFSINNSNDYVATCSSNKTVRIWSTNSNWTLIQTFTNHTSWVYSLEWINEDQIASGSLDYTIQIGSVKSGEINRSINASSFVMCLKLLSNGFCLASGLLNGKINIYDLNNNGSLISILFGNSVFFL